MHDYAILSHDRANIGRWLGILAILIAGGISQLFIAFSQYTGIEAFTKGTVTAGVLYFIFHFVFNKWAWKIPFFEIPNLNGVWIVTGKTLSEDGSVKYKWSSEIDIKQNWKQISIINKTNKSHSQSYTATLQQVSSSSPSWILTYSYKNQPKATKVNELGSHKGLCEIEFDSSLTKAEATYFNNIERKTYGTMKLHKQS